MNEWKCIDVDIANRESALNALDAAGWTIFSISIVDRAYIQAWRPVPVIEARRPVPVIEAPEKAASSTNILTICRPSAEAPKKAAKR